MRLTTTTRTIVRLPCRVVRFVVRNVSQTVVEVLFLLAVWGFRKDK